MAHRILVLGAGVMGTGITTLALRHGVHVTLVDTSDAILVAARTRIAAELRMAQLVAGPAEADPGVLETTTSVLPAIGMADAVIEAVVEDAVVKADVLATVSAAAPPGTPIITNTSSIPVDELADAVARPENLLGTHFMNPSYVIPTVEVIRGPRSGEPAMAAVADLLAVLGRKPIVVRDAPGFVTSRLLHPMINDAARIVQEGTASTEDVDALMTGCLGHPTGPLRTADLIGIDNLVDALWVLHKRTGDDRSRPCDLLLGKVRDGHHGRKTGRGFYDYEEVFR
ncbi:3-hydroxyacyl-CoA dehydrogenase family protein [Streptomyces kanamyceticus]|uniref:3-hydroxyacyl-CoA dehydrogenase family protein n=1 Tax=Streptomyces kanamyceticus TaxID=1967 RepID=E9KTB2_STRKN|nr:3-hydroxyacyl-CoA dehydrogenase family protein [Streptomyces kanamyceticus]ADU56244.1 glyceryl-ACP oxidoreductase [Streptomyces kanamyceticus]QEU89897.1 3-hydroxyacyl-CoA dehydrogenase family protein [Streptomyces kanamyceticus]